MNTRPLGTGGPLVTEIGFGAWALGGPWEFGWGPVDDNESIRALHRALDGGINWIDTAAVYGLGHSEEVVGRALKGTGQKAFLATKCGMVWDDSRKVKIHASPNSIRTEMEQSLRRLQRDHVDLYQIHWPDPETPVQESWGTLLRLKEEGKTRFIGVCNYDVKRLEECGRVAPVQSLQPSYSLLRRGVEKELLPYCRKNGIGVVAYSPMQSGLLSGSFTPDNLAPDDWRRKNQYFQDPYLSRALAFVETLRPIAARYHRRSVGQLAIAWVLQHSAVTSAIVGARTVRQVSENLAAAGFQISASDMQLIEEAYASTVGKAESPQ
jgi:aryl-alcohol dehydrogenase-like predicted oxidoreductase